MVVCKTTVYKLFTETIRLYSTKIAMKSFYADIFVESTQKGGPSALKIVLDGNDIIPEAGFCRTANTVRRARLPRGSIPRSLFRDGFVSLRSMYWGSRRPLHEHGSMEPPPLARRAHYACRCLAFDAGVDKSFL